MNNMFEDDFLKSKPVVDSPKHLTIIHATYLYIYLSFCKYVKSELLYTYTIYLCIYVYYLFLLSLYIYVYNVY